MRPVPAHRIGHAHGLLTALAQRGKLRPEDFLAEFSEAELFPPGMENPAGRARQLLSYARAAGLVREERGEVELTDLGKRYLQAGDPEDVFRVSPGQAEWLRRQLREKHLTESIFNGAAIALSLYRSLPEGEWVAAADVGRATAHLGGSGWADEPALRSQGERLTALLEDMELIGQDRALTETGHKTLGELQVPPHDGLKELAAELHPEGADGAARAAAQEREALGLGPAPAAASAAAAADPPPDVRIEAPEEEEAPAPGAGTDWDEAGPEDRTRAYPALTGAAEGRAGSSVAEEAAPALPPEEPAAPALQSGIRPVSRVVALRPEDLANWKAARDASEPFLDPQALRSAAEQRGLVIDEGVHVAAIAALASGRHLVLTGAPGAGKTALAQAIAEAAVQSGRCEGFLLTAAGADLQPAFVARAIEAGQWLVVDELDRVGLDPALGAVSTMLGGAPVDLPDGERLAPPPDWRMIATMAGIEQVGRASPAMRRRFVFVEVPVLERADLETLAAAWAGEDEVAAAVGRRLVAVSDVVPLGPGLYRDAIEYVKARRALAAADPDELLLEALAGFVLPQLEGRGHDVAARAVRATRP